MKKIIKPFVAQVLATALILFGFARKAKKDAQAGKFILSIYFHAPSEELFRFCVEWLNANGFNFLSQNDILTISQQKKPFPKGAVVITVDDGWLSNERNIVDIAKQYSIPVTIFVTTQAVQVGNFWWPYVRKATKMDLGFPNVEEMKTLPNAERIDVLEKIKKVIQLDREAFTADQIQKITQSRFINIGGHTVTHPILTNCENDEVFYELKESKELIEKWTGDHVNTFAYPNGNYGDREIEYLKNLGYKLAYTTKPNYLTKSRLQKTYELPRFCIFEDVSKPEAICRMLGIWQKFI